jgi:maltose O-acetyltransferase
MIPKIVVRLIFFIIEYLRMKKIALLKIIGLQLGKNVFIGNNVLIDPSFPWLISIDDDCTITDGVIILAHDASTRRHLGYSKIGKVSIGKGTFIGVRSIILPGVKIGKGVIVGSGSIVSKDIPDNTLAVGNPAVVICSTSDYLTKHKKIMSSSPLYKEGWTLETGITDKNKEIMKTELEDKIAYVI